jgi:hypothetical protein
MSTILSLFDIKKPRYLTLTISVMTIILSLSAITSSSSVGRFLGAFFLVVGGQILLWVIGIRMELLANVPTIVEGEFLDKDDEPTSNLSDTTIEVYRRAGKVNEEILHKYIQVITANLIKETKWMPPADELAERLSTAETRMRQVLRDFSYFLSQQRGESALERLAPEAIAKEIFERKIIDNDLYTKVMDFFNLSARIGEDPNRIERETVWHHVRVGDSLSNQLVDILSRERLKR